MADVPDFASYSYKHVPSSVDYNTVRAHWLDEFKDTVLLQKLPEFVDAHFGRYPTISVKFYVDPRATLIGLCRSLSLPLSRELGIYITRVNRNILDPEQCAVLEEAETFHTMVSSAIYRMSQLPFSPSELPGALFTRIRAVLETVYKRLHIILIDDYDLPLIAIRQKSWADEGRRIYMDLLNQMLRDNNRLEKALLAGVYPIPLGKDGALDMENMSTLATAVDGFDQSTSDNAPAPQSYLSAIGAMYGYTAKEVASVVESDSEYLSSSSKPIANLTEVLIGCFGGYNLGGGGTRCCATHVSEVLRMARSSGAIRFVRGPHVSVADLSVSDRNLALLHRGHVLSLASRFIHDFDAKESSCFVCPSGEQADWKRYFTLEREYRIEENHGGIGDIVAMFVYSGYLTIGANNALQIPNTKHRILWEQIRLVATFGTLSQLSQDSDRHELIDSLQRGVTIVLQELIESALDLLDSGCSYTEADKLEYACRHVASVLTMPYNPDRSNSYIEYDPAFFGQLHDGRTSWSITLRPFGRYIQRLVVALEFRCIDSDDSSYADAEKLALEAVKVAADKEQARSLPNGSTRLAVGIAIGHGKVVARHQH